MYLHQKQMNNKLFTLTYMETPLFCARDHWSKHSEGLVNQNKNYSTEIIVSTYGQYQQ